MVIYYPHAIEIKVFTSLSGVARETPDLYRVLLLLLLGHPHTERLVGSELEG